jgi:PAS domain S-box-containing protein
MDQRPIVVGVGAAAGGVDAFLEMLRALELSPRLAVIYVQPMESLQDGATFELIAKATPYKVVEIQGGKRLKSGTIFWCPPGKVAEVKGSTVRALPLEGADCPTAPIDYFLHSLASDQSDRAVGVILSGAGSDGTLGLKSISDAGGMTLSQDPESSLVASMPRSAAMTGAADHVLPPKEIAIELNKYARHLNEERDQISRVDPLKQIHDAIPAISKRLNDATHHNFLHYKPTTLARRIRRRMHVLKLADVDSYLKTLQEDSEEPQLLFRELLVSVTAFFRDPEAFRVLSETVISRIFQNRRAEDTVRIWVPGCATGEEAFSLAILCHQQFAQLERPPEVQIFATDIDEHALKIARAAVYPIGIEDDVPEDILSKYFIKRGKKFHVINEVRELVLFSSHNLISDPPFSRLDLITCRNLLIYLGPHLQKKLIPVFHYALRPNGYLMLGPSENISSHGDLFRSMDSKHRISQRKTTGVDSSTTSMSVEERKTVAEANLAPAFVQNAKQDLIQVMQRIVLDEFSPKSVIVEEDGKILCASADMHKYLTVGTGTFHNNVIKLARDGLRAGLRSAMLEAKSKRRRVDHDNLSVNVEGKLQRVMLTVQPMPRVGEEEELFLVVFHDAGLPMVRADAADATPQGTAQSVDPNDASVIIAHLEQELVATRSDLEHSVQKLESANDELKSSNEELRSLNEEMQTANEELETSKEEIQAVAHALEKSKSDLENLLRSTQIATVFLDENLTIRSFTPAATAIYNLIATDIGRPLSDLMPHSDGIRPLQVPSSVDGQEVEELPFQTHDGRWFVRRVLPYQSLNGQHEGYVVTFVDISQQKRWESELAQREFYLRCVIDNTLGFVGVLDTRGYLQDVNEAALRVGGLQRDEVIGKPFWECYWWSFSARVQQELKEAIASALQGEVVRYDVEVRVANDARMFIDFMLAPVKNVEGVITHLIPSGFDISERKRVGQEVTQRVKQLDLALESGQMGLWEWDLLTDQLVWSRQLAEILGYGAENLQPTTAGFLKIVHRSDRQALKSMIKSASSGELEKYELEFRVRHRSRDEWVWLHSRGTVRRDTDGLPLTFLMVAVDVTARKQRELSLVFLADLQRQLTKIGSPAEIVRTASQRVTDFLHLSHFLVIELDEEANVANVISDFCKEGELSLLGSHNMSNFLTAKEKRQLSGGVPLVINDTAGANRDARLAQNFRAIHVGASINAPNARSRKLSFMISATKEHAYDWREDEISLVRELSNILRLKLDRAAAEEALRASEVQLRLGMKVANFALARIDYREDKVELSSEAAKLYGFGESEIVVSLQRLHQTFHPDDRDVLMKAIRLSRDSESGGELAEEHRIVLGNGDVRWLNVRKRVFFEQDGDQLKPVSGILVAQDTTEAKRWQIELANRESHLRRVINNQLGFVGVIDREGILVEVDDRSIRQTGLTRDDVIGKHFADCPWWKYDPAVSQKIRDAMHRAFAGKATRFDVAIYTSKNHRFVIDFMLSPARDDEGNIIYLVPSGVDVSERKQAEAMLAESKERLSMAMASARMGTYEWEPESDIVTWDDQHLAITGLPNHQATGHQFLSLIHPDDREANRIAIEETIKTRCDYEVEFRITRPDGALRWLAARGKIVDANELRPMRFVGLNWDITESKEQAQRIRESEERLRNAAEAAGFGTVHANLELGTVTFSEELHRLVGLPRDVWVGLTLASVPSWVHPEDRDEYASHYLRLRGLAEGESASFDHRIVCVNGDVRWVRLSAKPIYTGPPENRKVSQLIGTIIDITKQREFETRLEAARREAEAANRSKSEFLANMSHEIRTPMTAILGYADLVAEGIQDPATMEHVRTIRRNGDYLLEIINDILDLSKIEAGKFELNHQLFSPHSIVEDVRSIMEVRAAEQNIQLGVQYQGLIPNSVLSDPKRLKQVLINLVGNAIKFTPRGRVCISVSYSKVDQKLRFQVIDTGIGISEQQRHKLFEPFSQGDGNVNREFGGTGLGLAISRRLTEMLGGEISVESQLGKGSTFTVTITPKNANHLTLIDPNTSRPQNKIEVPTMDVSVQGHVLVVDDRREIRFLSKKILSDAGAEVSEAEDGQIAVRMVSDALVSGKSIDLILLDMQMPRLDGYQTAQKLRELGFKKPIVALTADAMQGDMSRCLQSGCNDYLSKPIDKSQMLALVKQLIHRAT